MRSHATYEELGKPKGESEFSFKGKPGLLSQDDYDEWETEGFKGTMLLEYIADVTGEGNWISLQWCP